MPYLHRLRVEPADIDGLGHASNLVYVRWVLDAALAHSTACGLPEAEYQRRGQVWVVRRHEIEYLRPAFASDELVVETRVATMGAASSLRRTRILRGDEILARAATDWAFIDLLRQRVTRIPDDIRSSFPLEPDGA